MLAAAAAYDAAEAVAPGDALRAVIASCLAEEITLEELMGIIVSDFQITSGCADPAGSDSELEGASEASSTWSRQGSAIGWGL